MTSKQVLNPISHVEPRSVIVSSRSSFLLSKIHWLRTGSDSIKATLWTSSLFFLLLSMSWCLQMSPNFSLPRYNLSIIGGYIAWKKGISSQRIDIKKRGIKISGRRYEMNMAYRRRWGSRIERRDILRWSLSRWSRNGRFPRHWAANCWFAVLPDSHWTNSQSGPYREQFIRNI